MTRQASLIVLAVVALGSTGVTGCASWSGKQKGAVIGAAVGAASGAAIGKNNGSTARGAIIGAAVGGATGAIIGHQMDQQATELQVAIPGAKVERVGEGIQVTFASGLMYDFDSDAIRSDAAANLRQLATSLKQYPNTSLLIVGHTDASGSDSYNQQLSERRANSAMRYLSGQGVTPSRVTAAGRGETEPVGTNDSEAGRQINRRIEVAIYASAAARNGTR